MTPMGRSLAAAILLAGLSGCIVAPPSAYPPHGIIVPPGVMYAPPHYAQPTPDWSWMHHPSEGWGWHHPGRGWHRGWR